MRRLCAVLIGISACVAVGGQATKERPWILLERGRVEYSNGEYGKALEHFKSAIESAGIFPEAEVAIGDVFWESGEVELAEMQYKKAYISRNSLYVLDEKYAILYKLAHVYESTERYRQYEDVLVQLLADDLYFAQSEDSGIRDAIVGTYLDRGLDQLVVLYRVSESFASEAYWQLGWLYYRTGRFVESAGSLLFGLLPALTEAIHELQRYDPDYRYGDVTSFLADAYFRQSTREYLEAIGVFERLYYLGCATYAAGYATQAVLVWESIAASAYSGRFGELSAKQARSPWVEPLLGQD